jgi:Ca-activated chloride channel family protein
MPRSDNSDGASPPANRPATDPRFGYYTAGPAELAKQRGREQQVEQDGESKDSGGKASGGQRTDRQAWFFQNASGGLSAAPTPTQVPGEGEARLNFEVAPQAGAYAYQPNTESYPALVENPFRKSTEYPLSTFSIDVDTASYTNVRRFLSSRAMPPRDAVRVEELINYFQYSYPQPNGDVPFSITTDVADCPWSGEHRLLRVGLKGRDVPADQRPASNLVFLLDVSGSMDAPNKLPLVKEAMYLLVDKLTENDRVAIVVYAGNSGLALPPTNGENKAAIRSAISQLVASGSTNGGQGLQMAYDTAQSHFIKGGTNRVILATDGDFNVGIVDQNDLVRLIEEKAKSGVYLSALGFGIGNLKDGTLEKLADKGNGNYAYIDTLGEARRVLVEQLSGTLVTIAKDVKLQIEFNPAQATEYRLIGYEDRLMPQQDFHDDRKDAGEIGAGHSVTALYEIVPAERAAEAGNQLKYQRAENLTPAAATGELATIKLRYKQPDGQESRLIEQVVTDRRPQQAEASRDVNFATAVAAFGMLLRESPYRGDATYQKVLSLAEQGLASDPNGYRSEFVQLVRQAREISGRE